jgi:hypothetical protein
MTDMCWGRGGVVGLGRLEYRWRELQFPRSSSAGWAHPGVAVLPDGALITGHPDGGALALFSADGRFVQEIDTPLTGLHGITLVEDQGEERLWVADNGHKFAPAQPTYSDYVTPGRVVQMDLSGRVTMELTQPDSPAYENAHWSPCAVAVVPPGDGGDGSIWVADGYGQSLLHCFTNSGTHLYTLDGSESGTPFDTPHGLLIDRRKPVPELYVADRSNRRLVVYSVDGSFLRTISVAELTSPSALAIAGDLLVVAELFGAITALDIEDRPIGALGDESVTTRPGWPNRLDGGTYAPHLHAMSFNSPHGVTADANGNIFVAEWLVGGRLVQLEPID